MTHDFSYDTPDTWQVVKIVLTLSVSKSNGLGVKVLWRFGGKGWLTESINWLIDFKRPCKLQCTFYCHRVVKNIALLFVYVGPPPLGSKWPQQTQLSDGVGC